MQWTKEDAAIFKAIMEKYAENMMGVVALHRLVIPLKEGCLEIILQKMNRPDGRVVLTEPLARHLALEKAVRHVLTEGAPEEFTQEIADDPG
jgi:hypothetical protein